MPRTSRSLQSVTLSLGLVAIPVGLHATRRRGVVAVGTQIARGKSYLVAVRSSALGMVMHTLHHAEEVHVEDQVPHGEPGRVSAAERELAAPLEHAPRKRTVKAKPAARRAKPKSRSSSSSSSSSKAS